MLRTAETRAFAVLLFGACVIGFAPIFPRISDAGPVATAFWRFAFALPLLSILCARSEGGTGRPTRTLAVIGAVFAGDFTCWHYGIAFTSVANATVLSNLTPLVVTLVVWRLTREAPSRLFLLALALAVGGAVVMGLARGGGGQGTNPPLGNFLSAGTALFYGAYFVMVRSARGSTSAARIMFWSTLFGAPLLLVAALLLGEEIAPASLGGWAACLGLGLVHVAGQGSIAWALGRLPAPTVSVVVLVQPVVAAALGWLLFAERVTPVQALGAAIALGGVVLAQLQTKSGGAPIDAPPAEASSKA